MKKHIILTVVVLSLLVSITLISATELENPNEGNVVERILNMDLPSVAAIASFLGLTDTPSSYTGSAGKCAMVNSNETALEFGDCNATSGGGSAIDTNFTHGGVLYGDIVFVNKSIGIRDPTNDVRMYMQAGAMVVEG